MGRYILLPLIIAAIFGASLFAQGFEEPVYLLLKNGQLVRGIVKAEGHKFWVIKKSGSRMAFDRQRVVVASNDLSEIYWAKYAQLAATDSKGHIALYRWCLENDLLNEAKNELDIIQFMSIETRQLMQLQDSLVAKLEHQRKRLLAEATAMESLPDLVPKPSETSTKKTDQLVRPASFDSDLEQRHQAALKRSQHFEKLRSMTKQLPDHSVVMFKRKIEPILIRSCYTAKCHDNGSIKLPLTIAGKGMPVPKRLSQENLYQVLKYTNTHQPLESALLSAAVLPHAGREKPIIKIQSQQFQFLRSWLISISTKPFNFHPIPRSFLESDLLVTTRQSEATENQDSASTPDVQAAELPPAKAAESDTFAPIPKKEQKTPSDKNPKSSEPKNLSDPFDPEKFNKNFRKRS